MEEVLGDDDDETKVEKSNVEKMEKHSGPEAAVPEPPAAGTSSRTISPSCHHKRATLRLNRADNETAIV